MLLREGNPCRRVAHVELDETRYGMGSFGGVLDMSHVIADFERTQTSFRLFGHRLLPLGDLLLDESDSWN
ncbi:MAG: hypothetical protein ABIR54_18650 [Burkholderiaceae bacterium]|jgi:hypothetical protein